MTITRLVFVAGDEAPWPFLRTTSEGEVLQRGVVPAGAARPETDDIDRLVVPGSDATARWLELPDRSDAQARSAVTFLLQTDLIDDGEQLHAAVGPALPDGRRVAVVTRPERIRQWLESARARGVEPASMTPDFLMLPEPEGDEVLVAGFGDLTVARGRDLGCAMEADLVSAVTSDRPVRRLSMQELEPMLASAALEPQIDLLQGRFGPRPPALAMGGWRRLAVLAIALLLSPLVLLCVQIGRDHLIALSIEGRIRERLEAAYPGSGAGGDPVRALEARLDQLRRADQFPDLAAGLFSVIERSPGAQIDTLSWSQDGILRARIAYSNYSDIDQIVAAGRAAQLDIRQESSVTEGARVTSELTIRRAAQ